MIKHDIPWEHYTWENFVEPAEQEYLYNRCLIQLDKEKYESSELFLINDE